MKWEYKSFLISKKFTLYNVIVFIGSGFDEFLNELGRDGWQLCTIKQDPDGLNWCICKRLINNKNQE